MTTYMIVWQCPNCGRQNSVSHKIDDERKHQVIRVCDSEFGGCDTAFVIETTAKVELSAVYAMVKQ